jgi:hypothetical protein
MRAIIFSLILMSVVSLDVSAEVIRRSTFVLTGTNYVSIIKDGDLDKSPLWNETDECPPLSPRRAIRAAQTTITNLFKGVGLMFDYVSLRPIGRENKWIYEVQFTAVPPGGLEGYSEPIILFVLMSGEVVLPKPECLIDSTRPDKRQMK